VDPLYTPSVWKSSKVIALVQNPQRRTSLLILTEFTLELFIDPIIAHLAKKLSALELEKNASFVEIKHT
jgi:hypothetical protein